MVAKKETKIHRNISFKDKRKKKRKKERQKENNCKRRKEQ